MEYLTRLLAHNTGKKGFGFHPLCKQLRLTNLCFADDLILFCKGVKDEAKLKILDLMQMDEGNFPLKYLGVHLRPTKWQAADCGVILDKLHKNLNCLASKNLSFAGRAQLIHSVLLGIQNFWMSIFILPSKVTAAIDKCCRDFLWGSRGNRSKFHLPSWEKVCLLKNLGGIGFREGKKWNVAVMAKYIWASSKFFSCSKKKKKEKNEDAELIMKQARSAIVMNLSDNVLRQVIGEKTAAGLWKKLEDLYMKKSTATKIFLKGKMYVSR
ncbi:uncharacterized protein LOC133831933 [Humulus lupulus]|uniref:uncharacterized protein LOC133831933 n=1 Tax=Humulus lupulus TaxID=3486 RepID=UPI002B417197|nr:uncharacterized protein LOC133831933 [Humulus lupulus]